MRRSTTLLLLSFTLTILHVQGGVLRGSQSQPTSATRLFRIAKKTKNKTALSINNNKLSSGSAAGAAGSVVKNKKKCKKKKVKVKNTTNTNDNSNAVKSSSSSSAGGTVSSSNGGGAATVTMTTTAPKSTTTVNAVKSTSSTSSVNSSNNSNGGGSAVTTATKTTTAPKTTTKTTPYPDDFFAVSSTTTTTKATTTKATTKATEVVQKATEGQEQKTTTLPPIDGLVFRSERSMDTAINVAASTDNVNNVAINANAAAAAEWEWIDICNPDGTLIPPNTYSPTISPGEVDDWSGWLNVDVVTDDDDEIDGDDNVNDETVVIDGSDETNNAMDTSPTNTDATVSSPSDDPITVNEDNTENDGIIITNDDDDNDDALSSPGCTAFQKNQVYTTSLPAVVSFLYEISVDATTTTATTATANSTNVNSILQELQQSQIEFIGSKLIQCELFIRRRRQLQESQVDGISAAPDDTILDESCTVLPPSTTNTTCHVIQGQMTLYLRENSPYSSVEQSTTQALKLLMTEFNRENSPFVSNGSYGVDGVRAIRYVTSTSDIENGGYSKGEVPTVNVGGAIEETDNMASKNSDNNEEYTSVGIALISVGAVALVSILVLVTKLGRESMKNGGGKDRTYAEFDDDENDLDKEWGGGGDGADDNSMNDKTMGSVSSNDSPTRGLAVIEGDESIYTHGTTSTILRELIVSEAAARAHNIGPDEDSTRYQQPIFLKTDEDSYGMEVYTINKNRSIYTQDSRVERPRFENPARLRGNRREYVVDDTVEF
eukprot:scaffold77778_cov54-Cyclotella_meneghiniana.AAC.3